MTRLNPRRRTEQRAQAGEGPSERFLELARRSREELEEVMLRGHTPDLDELVGWEFSGINTPRWARAAGIKKFAKGFERRDGGDPDRGPRVLGYNRPVTQDRLRDAWRVGDRRFGWFRVAPVDPTERDNAYLHALLLDYGRGGNRPWDPTGTLRDYLVQVDPADPDLYLGKAYLALGPARVPVSYFVLERLRRVPG
ncbi:MAG TPA: hypothetical protein VKZ63_20960 [Kofleriaceae bacterium]|nr:hypothetical protein [Kofleriaceae bacterium]